MSHNQLINMNQNGRLRRQHRTGDAEPGITGTHRLTGDSVFSYARGPLLGTVAS